MAIPDSFIQELKYKCDIEDIISQYVQLKRRGSVLVGLCPFHSEKTPSFTVFPDHQNYFCFGCRAGGDVITFIKAVENIDYIDAIKQLASLKGMPVPEDQDESPGKRRMREQIYKVNTEAARFYHSMLSTEKGKAAAEYIKMRALTPATVKHFGLGAAIDEWDALTKHLVSLGFDYDVLKSSGLVRVNKNGGYYDYFKNRVMFPIIDVRGNVIAFGGRVMGKDEPKYLNSPDTPVFKKSLNLFALNFAKNASSERLILCEGYMDVIAMHQGGFTNAVATLGTAITPDQARLMSRYAKEIVVAYDSDKAGQAATQKAIQYLTDAGLTVKVLKITGGKDPDEFIRTYGADRFKLLLEGSENHVEYRLMEKMAKYNLEKPDEKVAYLKDAAVILSEIASPVERDVYAGRTAEISDISKASILLEVERILKAKAKKDFKQALRKENAVILGVRDIINPEKAKNLKIAKSEEGLIGILYRHQDKIKEVSAKISPEDFVTEFNRKVYKFMLERYLSFGEIDLAAFNSDFSTAEMGRISEMIINGESDNIDKSLDDFVSLISSFKDKSIIPAAGDMNDGDFGSLLDGMRKAKKDKGE